MCGIAGLFSLGSDVPGKESLRRMIDIQRHRGPDESGILLDGGIGLGHARLNIIDPEGGHQPMQLPEIGLAITFNGEIFNYLELRKELAGKGHRFGSRSDTEVILHLFQEYGPACVDRMNGQWAFAIWDSPRQSLFLSRDRAGIRPLFYTIQSGFFAFASEAKALLALPFVPRRIDPIALAETFVFWHPLAPRSAFEGISIVPPGHNLTIGIRHPAPRIERYWKIDYTPEDHSRPETSYIGELRSLLDDAAHIMLRADVPVGAYLSGGLDSSVTTALIRKEESSALKTFSVAFGDARFDESSHQQAVSDYLGTQHSAVTCQNGDIGRIFPKVIWHAEQPIIRTAPAPLYMLSQLVRDSGFKVVLTGEGADEVLGGYDIFKEAKVRYFWSRHPESAVRPRLLKRLYPYMKALQSQSVEYLKAFFDISPEALQSPFFSHLPRWQLGLDNLRFLSDEVKAELRGWNPLEEFKSLLPQEYESWDWLSRAQYLEFAFLMPGYILSAQGDRMALAHGVESRFPFLDHRVIEFGAKMPLKLRINGLVEKYALRKAARGLIPESVLKRIKQPYRAPDAESFSGPRVVEPDYVADVMSGQRLEADRLFNPTAVGLLLKKARQGNVSGVRDDMAFVGILSSQLLAEQFMSPGTPSPC
jgi:asparagine synthase (glutamine-hydrolysing)